MIIVVQKRELLNLQFLLIGAIHGVEVGLKATDDDAIRILAAKFKCLRWPNSTSPHTGPFGAPLRMPG